MTVDAATALHELGIKITAGPAPGTWRLLGEPGLDLVVSPAQAVLQVDARVMRRAVAEHHGRARLLLVGGTATSSVANTAGAGEFDLLTCDPTRLIHEGVSLEVVASPGDSTPLPRRGRPAWGRWALMRYLVLTREPARQADIAAALGLTQQAVSLGLRSLGAVVTTTKEGSAVSDRSALLDSWIQSYPGPGGFETGWYGLNDPVTQARTAQAIAQDQSVTALVGGDVAADVVAPWRLPTTGLLYVDRPVDLSQHGFVPAPLDEANLTLCEPRDPTLWRLSHTRTGWHLADPMTVLWDLTRQPGAEEAAGRLRETVLTTLPGRLRLRPAS